VDTAVVPPPPHAAALRRQWLTRNGAGAWADTAPPRPRPAGGDGGGVRVRVPVLRGVDDHWLEKQAVGWWSVAALRHALRLDGHLPQLAASGMGVQSCAPRLLVLDALLRQLGRDHPRLMACQCMADDEWQLRSGS
jgi:hypothetical protein